MPQTEMRTAIRFVEVGYTRRSYLKVMYWIFAIGCAEGRQGKI